MKILKSIINKTLLLVLLLSINNLIYSQVSFENVTEDVGMSLSRGGGFFGGGVSFCDFDGDGLEDVVFATENSAELLIYKNNGFTFENQTLQLGVTNTSNVQSILWADYDNDGDKDLFFTCKDSYNRLYRNDNNNFTEVTGNAGLSTDVQFSTAAAWADYDNDGFIDLYVGHRSDLIPNSLYKNNGNGTFINVTTTALVGDTLGGTLLYKFPLAISFVDYNNDNMQDIYIANDKENGNTLFKNNGDGTFEDVSEQSNTNLYFNAMGIAVGDYDNDGDWDMYVSNSPEGNALLKNNGDGTFTDVANDLNVSVNKICWGTNFIDIDNDTDLDLFVVASAGAMSMSDPERQNELFENQGDGTFIRLNISGINTDTSISYGTASGDFNNDGYCDIVVINSDPTYSALWQNSGASNNWIKLQLEGTDSNRDGIGSVINIHIDGNSFKRPLLCGSSYLSQNSSIQTIGVGSKSVIDSIIINWPSGNIDVMKNVNVNSLYVVEEGGSVTSIDKLESTVLSYKLHQNYPNPFNPGTQISFSLPSDSRVMIRVFDVLGQEIVTLINGNLAVGSHNIDFNAASLNSGVYFYRIDAAGLNGESFSSVKKMILTK